jgi:hypothetical protein
MATNSGFSLDYDSILRIARAVWEVERSLGIPGEYVSGDPGGPQNTRMIEVNGAVSGGLYPAICKDHDGTNWVYSESCFAVDSNGAALTVGNTYIGRRTRSVTDGGVAKSVFTVQASGGGGGAAGSTLIIVKLTNTVAMTGLQQTYNPTTKVWTDGTITLNLVEINGNTMPVNKRMPALLISGTTYAVGLDPAAVTSVTCAGGSLTVAGRS